MQREKNMGNVTIFSQSIPQIGYIARTCTQGDEFDMVNFYIESLVLKYSKFQNKNVAIFIEPQLDTGYPDIVLVEYSAPIFMEPNKARKKINATDLKILYYIHCQKHIALQELSEKLAYTPEEVRRSIQRLANANLIYLSKNGTSVRNTALSKYCPIKRIIAIEAKLDKWNEAIVQAEHNIWFATESYVLLNKEKCSATILERCKGKGIGVILVNGHTKTALKSAVRHFPVSYASLQFNEWLCRYFRLQEDNDDRF